MKISIFNLAICSLLLVSCAKMDTMLASTKKMTQGIKGFSISDLRPSSIPVVEAREKDLKNLPLGKERALAYERKKSFWAFFPVEFEEPELPLVDEVGANGSLLPPKPL